MTRMEIILLNFGLGSSITNLIYFVANLFSHQNTGTWRSGAHGWFAFLKPLQPGNHTVYYQNSVEPTTLSGAGNSNTAQFTYHFNVE